MREIEKKRKKKKRRGWRVALCVFLALAFTVCGGLQIGCWYTAGTWDYWRPDYERIGIRALLEKSTLSEEDYELLYRQTGLTKLAVDDMRHSETGREKILKIQEVFFSDLTVKSRRFAPFTYMDEIKGSQRTLFCDLRDGDIIVTATTRVSWWQYGHACIVVDGVNQTIAECIGPGVKSGTSPASSMNNLVNFLVLRPKLPQELKSQIADYILSDMMGLTYRFTTGILTKKYVEDIKISQCAHFVWYAYKKFGVDLDSNGGGLVKAQDMALSPHVELVQAVGFNLDTLWS